MTVRSRRWGNRRGFCAVAGAAAVAACAAMSPSVANAQRLKGVDISDWQGNLSQTTWNNVKAQGRDFVFLRSDRGGTSGYYDETNANNSARKNTLGQRYDDLYFEQNATRAVAAGIYIGPYHFGRADIFNSGLFNVSDSANTGADEARHMLQASGAWMKPGFIRPVFDLEAGDTLSTAGLSTFCVDFANTILAAKGVSPICYVNQNYALNEVNSTVPAAMPTNWVARWPNQTNPEAIDVQNIDPTPSPLTANVYGVWYPAGQPYPTPQPWVFWQYGSSNTNVAGITPVDVDVLHGDLEVLKDQLVPALWVKGSSVSNGLWSDVHNWNSDIDPSGKGPAARLPNNIDTVILDNAGFSGAITVNSGNQTVRKLITRETLAITGGSLSVIFTPHAPRSIDLSAGTTGTEFDSNVTISGTGAFSGHTIQLDTTRTLNVNGGSLTFAAINMQGTGRISVGGDATLAGFAGGAGMINTTGTGTVDLAGGTRTLNIPDGAAAIDVQVNVPVTNGSLVKSGAGALNLPAANTLAGSVTVNNGNLLLDGANGTLTSASGFTINAGGTITLDSSAANNSNRLANASVTLNGGTLAMVGNGSSSTVETTGNLAVAAGASAISEISGFGPGFSFGTYTRSSGATLNITAAGPSALMSFTNLAAGSFVDQGTFVNGADYAVYSVTTAPFMKAMVVGAGASDYATSMITSRHVKLSSSVAAQPSIQINTLNLAGATVGLDMAAGGTLTLVNGGIIKSGGGASAISGGAGASITTPIGGGAEYVINTVAANDQLTVSIPIGGGPGLTKTGAGTLILSAAGAYTGATTVAQGSLLLGHSDVVPDSSTVVVGSGATFSMNNFNDIVGGITMGDGTLSGAGAITLGGASPTVSYNGVGTGGTISNGALSLGTGAGTTTLDVADGAAASELTISAIMIDGVGSHAISKTGAGRLALSGTNSFTGGITVAGGTLSVNSINSTATVNQPLGNSSADINLSGGGALEYTGSPAIILHRVLNIGAGGGTIRATLGAVNLNGISATGGVRGNGNPVTFDANGGDITCDAISGTGTTVTKTGPNLLTLSGTNSYTGNTIVNGGTLAYTTPSNLGTSNAIVLSGGGTLRTLAAINETRNVALNAGGGSIDTNSFNATFGGIISGAGGLTKNGTGTLTVSNTSTYTGPTIVNAGTLNLTGSTALASTVIVNAGGTIAGSGVINGNATIVTGGAINFASGGTIMGNLTANGGNWNGVGLVINGTVSVNTYNAAFTLGPSSSLQATQTNIDAGTLAGSGTLIGSATLTNAGTINLSGAGMINGSLTVGAGGGTWAGSGSVQSTTTVTADTFTVTGTLGGSGGLTMNAGTTLAGNGTINKSVVLGTNVRVSASTALGPLTFGSPLTWGASGLHLYSGVVNTPGDTISVSLQVTGTLGGTGTAAISGGTVTGSGTINKPTTLGGGGNINFSSLVFQGTTYTGSIANTLNVIAGGGNWSGIGSVSGAVTVSAGNLNINSGANLTAPANVTVNGTGTISGIGSTSLITGSVNYASSAVSTFNGNITGPGKTLTMNNTAGKLVLTGTNNFTGATTVNDGILQIASATALNGTSGVVTTETVTTPGAAGHGGTVQLANNVSINLPLTLGGAGLIGISITPPGSTGALDSSFGTNTWVGQITLAGGASGGTDPLINQVSAAASATLVLSNVVKDQTAVSATLAKSGDGDVVLTGAAPNTYSNLTRVYGGRLILEKDGALGAAGSPTGATGNTFQLAGSNSTIAFRAPASSPAGFNYATSEWINLEGNGASGLGQLDNLGGSNTFAGNLGLSGPSNVSTIGVSTGSLLLTGSIYTRGASGSRTLNKLGAGTLIIAGDSSAPPTNPSNTGSLTASTVNVNAGTLEFRGATANLPGVTTWNANSGGTLKITSGTLTTGAVGAGGTGRIDLTNRKIVLTAQPVGSWNGAAYTDATGLIASGYNGGDFLGAGIVTTQSGATGGNTLTSVGAASNSDLGLATFGGTSVGASDTLVAYTYAGDANLDGVINGDDYFQIDSSFPAAGHGWFNGDFNYDGVINGDDYFLIDSNFSAQGPPIPTGGGIGSVSAVPEPTSSLILVAALALCGSKRPRRRG